MDNRIRLVSGYLFDLAEPEASVRHLGIVDVAHSLAHICRFNGHTREFYSVAQHSVLVSRLCPARYAMEGLLHDATEALLGDVASPLKAMLPDYKALEARVERAVLTRFGLVHIPEDVKTADRLALVREQASLMNGHPQPEQCSPIVPLPPLQAQLEFLRRYLELA